MMVRQLPFELGPNRRDLEGIEAERDAIAARMEKLPLKSAKYALLQARLQLLTLRALKLENERNR